MDCLLFKTAQHIFCADNCADLSFYSTNQIDTLLVTLDNGSKLVSTVQHYTDCVKIQFSIVALV